MHTSPLLPTANQKNEPQSWPYKFQSSPCRPLLPPIKITDIPRFRPKIPDFCHSRNLTLKSPTNVKQERKDVYTMPMPNYDLVGHSSKLGVVKDVQVDYQVPSLAPMPLAPHEGGMLQAAYGDELAQQTMQSLLLISSDRIPPPIERSSFKRSQSVKLTRIPGIQVDRSKSLHKGQLLNSLLKNEEQEQLDQEPDLNQGTKDKVGKIRVVNNAPLNPLVQCSQMPSPDSSDEELLKQYDLNNTQTQSRQSEVSYRISEAEITKIVQQQMAILSQNLTETMMKTLAKNPKSNAKKYASYCKICDTRNHSIFDCEKRHPNSRVTGVKACFNCGNDHRVTDCPSLKGSLDQLEH
ncbi:unnamed protein product [Owenia fusiformis]|uniref:Uncharacterized protein n=1 Tax=Owenia fusiformis TaxID=6347 RepID=A0A8J1U7H9_OWEFU|nr:unnamed protein product [Owenia fusiformis]